MIPTTRKMSVVRAPGTNDMPMIRLVNNFLYEAGFTKGTLIEVSYHHGEINIKKLENENSLQTNKVPVPSDEQKLVQRSGQGTSREEVYRKSGGLLQFHSRNFRRYPIASSIQASEYGCIHL